MKQIRPHLHLKEIDFEGFLTNQSGQHWHIAEDEEKYADDSVKQRMIDWFLEKEIPDSECPLNVFETRYLGSEQALHAATDDSWSIVCPKKQQHGFR